MDRMERLAALMIPGLRFKGKGISLQKRQSADQGLVGLHTFYDVNST